MVIGFSERGGGVSEAPFASLNLAAHVGDDPRRSTRTAADCSTRLGLDAHIATG